MGNKGASASFYGGKSSQALGVTVEGGRGTASDRISSRLREDVEFRSEDTGLPPLPPNREPSRGLWVCCYRSPEEGWLRAH